MRYIIMSSFFSAQEEKACAKETGQKSPFPAAQERFCQGQERTCPCADAHQGRRQEEEGRGGGAAGLEVVGGGEEGRRYKVEVSSAHGSSHRAAL